MMRTPEAIHWETALGNVKKKKKVFADMRLFK